MTFKGFDPQLTPNEITSLRRIEDAERRRDAYAQRLRELSDGLLHTAIHIFTDTDGYMLQVGDKKIHCPTRESLHEMLDAQLVRKKMLK